MGRIFVRRGMFLAMQLPGRNGIWGMVGRKIGSGRLAGFIGAISLTPFLILMASLPALQSPREEADVKVIQSSL